MIRKFIKKFIQGDTKRTAFSADTMNEIVANLNQFIGMRAGKGIVITRADSGWVVSWDPNSQGEAALLGEGGGSGGSTNSIAFQGDWSGADTYVVNDIVIKQLDPDNFDDGSAGTYICIADITVAGTYEPGVDAGWGAYWAVFAKGFWTHIEFKDPATQECTDIDGKTITVTQPLTDSSTTQITPGHVKTWSSTSGEYAGLDLGNFTSTDGTEDVTGSPGKIRGVKYSATSFSGINATISSGSLPRSFTWEGGFGYVSHYTGYGAAPYLFVVRVDPNCAMPTFSDGDRAVVIDISACQNIDTSGGVHTRLLKIRELDICDGGVAKKMLVLCSAPYTLAP